MLGYRDEAGRFYPIDQGVAAYQQFVAWQYQVGDWIVEPGVITHHLRIIELAFDENSFGLYRVFDTSLRNGHGDYTWCDADNLEPKTRLYKRPNRADVPAILERAAQCRYIDYSIFSRTDCESIQGWIHTGNENDRWSSQVLAGVSLGIGGLILAFGQPAPKRRPRRYPRRSR